ncbi:MAG TPA: ATP-binding protein, partial [Micavibrio sp.]
MRATTIGNFTILTFWRRLTMLALALLISIGFHGDSRAQSGTFAAQLNLNDGETSYNLAPYAYVTRDPHKSISYASLMERHLAGKRGDVLQGSMLALGATGMPHWIVVTLNNRSQEDRFVLDFGSHLDGRVGQIEKMFIYDHTARRRIIDTISQSHVPGGKNEQLTGTSVQMNIGSGTTATLVMYVVPRAGVPLTLGFNLMTEGDFLARHNTALNPNNLAFLIFALAIGFHLGIMLLTRQWGSVSIVAYLMTQMALFMWGNNAISSPLSETQNVTVLLATFAMMAGFAVNKTYFNITRHDGAPFRIVCGVPAIVGLVMLLCTFILPADNLIRPLIIAVMLLFAYTLLALMAVAQMMQGKTGALYMAIGWACVLAGTFITLVATTNVISPSSFTLSAYWYSLLPQALLMGFAAMLYFLQRDIESAQEEEELEQEQQQVSRIVQSREGQELNRLKRLVEHERQVMQELRDREVEQNEEMRLARITADEANRAKSAFLAVVSHEIRTPMTGIMGMVRLLLDTPMNSSQKDYAQTIQDSGDAMMSLLNDILDFEKIESGKLDLELIDFDLHRLANSIITLMSGHAHNKGVYLKLELDPQVPRYVVGDPVRLRQVLLNLVGNSIKFTKEGGVTIVISRDANSENLSRGNVSKVHFAVRDTGVGISKEAQHNLFRPFAQADSSVSRKFGGTGLGLAISQRLIEAMGNRIAIDSEEGRGSTFHFTLILEEGRAEAAAGGSADSVSLSQKSDKALKILVVEDNEINQKLLKEFIGRMGHEVIQAMSGEDGIEAVQREKPDMIFMDLEMSGISGMGATKAIRALRDPAIARTPVIALTGNTRDEDIRACYAANMNGHLAKPVDPIRLRQQIEKVITGKLDNPVEIAESDEDDYIHTTQLAEPAAKAAPVKPAPTPTPAPVEAAPLEAAPIETAQTPAGPIPAPPIPAPKADD